ncbi:HEPN domain protein [mine drainage metagenome]|uniref:HEPN domain protein n=1 Tax=mine drainage metagenome TaxID=410659 RepID=A0A1J5QYM6_9ZZZZ
MRWERGRATIDDLITTGRLTPVAANRELAESYLMQAKQHTISAEAIADDDPPGAFQLVYDAARKTLAAILVNQGLRPRGHGAHAVLLEVVVAQLEPPRQEAFREFDWMRRTRNDTEYPEADKPIATDDDVRNALPVIREMIARAEVLIPNMPPY